MGAEGSHWVASRLGALPPDPRWGAFAPQTPGGGASPPPEGLRPSPTPVRLRRTKKTRRGPAEGRAEACFAAQNGGGPAQKALKGASGPLCFQLFHTKVRAQRVLSSKMGVILGVICSSELLDRAILRHKMLASEASGHIVAKKCAIGQRSYDNMPPE